MAPFARACMTSYSTLMVTMALSASVSKLQPSEICVTSILTSPGHSTSKPMAPFQRASMTSYSSLMVTRGTVQGAQWIPFPSFRYGKKTGNNENLRRKHVT